jgi:hypothetical protein
MKFLMIKYKFIWQYSKYPLSVLKIHLHDSDRFRVAALTDYYYGEYRQVFDPERRYFKVNGCPSRLWKNATNDRLLELYFGLPKGTLQPFNYYLKEPISRPYSRYDPL